MDQSLVGHPVTLIIKAPNQKYTDQTINCFLDWTVGKLKTHLSSVYPSKPEQPRCHQCPVCWMQKRQLWYR
uniref:Uncharacterized protein n=1 Tax=Gopherus evgoodei TaxID=1825980 RepID=A0A8C4VUS8_9SAUR